MGKRVWALRGPKGARPDAPPSTRLRVENNLTAESAGVTVYLYAEIGPWYDGVTAADFAAVLAEIGPTTALTVRINSPGGDVYDALAIYNLLKAHGGQVTTVVDGIAASAASYIMQAGSVRKIARNAEVMIHDAWGYCSGNAAAMRKWAEELDRMSDNIADIYAQASGRDVAEIRAAMVEETWYSGREAVAAGLADELTEPETEEDDDPMPMDDRAAARAKAFADALTDVATAVATTPIPVAFRDIVEPEDVAGDIATDVATTLDGLFATWQANKPTDPWGDFVTGLTSTTDKERTAS